MKNPKPRAIVAGYICLDITPLFNLDNPINDTSQFLIPGKLIETGQAEIQCGGSAANTGLAMARLGTNVSLMGKIGRDAFGNILMDILEKQDCPHNMIISNDATSYSIVLAPPGLDRMFLHFPGANSLFSAVDLDYKAIEKAELFHFGYPNLMKSMYQDNGHQTISMFSKIKPLGVITSLDMALADTASPAGKVNWRKILPELLPYVDIFAPSLDEIAAMVEPEKYKQWKKLAGGQELIQTLSIEKDIEPMAQELLNWGVKILLIKCGSPGIYYRTNNAKALSAMQGKIRLETNGWANQQGFESGFKAKTVLSTAGAGDVSIAGFLTAFLKQKSLKHCTETAAAAGAACVESFDRGSSLTSYEKLRKRIEAGWEKQDSRS
ncbi:MAG: carbohydrate kinase family protein [Spirochaetales bacterium]|nr:carbohydrate kinase family protein [Spirochaetales bacterium]